VLASPDLLRTLTTRAATRTEAEVQAALAAVLSTSGLGLSAHDIRLEAPVGDHRRIDVEAGLTVFEVKRDLRPAHVVTEAITQLAGYVHDRATLLGQRYIGVLTDGADWRLYHLAPQGTLNEVSRFQVTDSSDYADLIAWLGAILATEGALTPVPDEVERRLGSGSPGHALDLAALRDLWAVASQDSEATMKRHLWSRLLTTALGSAFTDDDELFLAHTYLVIVADVIAHAVVRIPVAGLNPVSLLAGDRFREAGVHGVVEADFFSWVTDSPGGATFVRDVVRRVSGFTWDHVEHDVLKHLYESVIDLETRKRLGEYYTPDWLAERVVAETVNDPLNQRVADVACGSGTFLFHAVRRYLSAAEKAGKSNTEALDGATRHITGLDLHPVAVALARTTYLLALGASRLSGERDDISVPVYLGDSLQWAIDHSVLSPDGAGATISVTDDLVKGAMPLPGFGPDELVFPESVMADPTRFDSLVDELMRRATTRPRGSAVPNIQSLLRTLGLAGRDADTLRSTFVLLCKLHDDHRNHVWGYYVRNLVRPLWLSRSQGKVDVLVGNPPWLSQRFMPPEMQAAFRERCQERNLWAGGRVATQQDLSGYFAVRAAELYLQIGGKIGMVMPLAALSRMAFAGFRTGNYGQLRFAFQPPWSLDKVRPAPFLVPSGVVFAMLRKNPQPPVVMPTATVIWEGSLQRAAGSAWADVEPFLAITQSESLRFTVDDLHLSPYAERFRQGATIVPRVLHVVERLPATGGLGLPRGIARVRSKRSTQEKEPWKSLPDRDATVEDRFIFHLYYGTTVLPFRVQVPELVVLPHTDSQLLNPGEQALDRWPRLADWVAETEHLWTLHRSEGTTANSTEWLNYNGKLESQFPIAPLRVIYTASGSTLAAAVVRDTQGIIEHVLYWAATTSLAEARYLTAILNAPETTRRVGPLQARGLFGARHFDKYVWQLGFPAYDKTDERHQALAHLADEAEVAAAKVDLSNTHAFQTARAKIRQTLTSEGIHARLDDAVRGLLDNS
jgi:hypothetical protein